MHDTDTLTWVIASLIIGLVLFNLGFVLWAYLSSRRNEKITSPPSAGGDCGCPHEGDDDTDDVGDEVLPDEDPKPSAADPFLIKPYLQLGTDQPAAGNSEEANRSLAVLWHVREAAGEGGNDRWLVQVTYPERKTAISPSWLNADKREIAWPVCTPDPRLLPPHIDSIDPAQFQDSDHKGKQGGEIPDVHCPGGTEPALHHSQYSAVIGGLAPGERFFYSVLKNGVKLFSAEGRAPKSASQPYRFIAVGDVGNGKPPQRKVAYQMWLAQPDFVAVPGDMVYKRGRSSEYLARYFPVYNAESADPTMGAPIIRSTFFVAAPGNHDIGKPTLDEEPDLNRFADLFAYFVFWSQPLNGPALTAGGANVIPLRGEEGRKKAFLDAAGTRYPRMASFSFDYGNAHWTVLDSNVYMDWTNAELLAWLEADLASAKDATWKFVLFHHPGFASNRKHQEEQRMRLLSHVFEKHGVDVVFSGHDHCYERQFPLKFKLVLQPDGSVMDPRGFVNGEITTDREYDGATNTRPNGVIYIITGAGGGKLDSEDLHANPSLWQPFTQKLVGDRRSISVCDVDGKKLTVRQISEDGEVVDSFVIEK